MVLHTHETRRTHFDLLDEGMDDTFVSFRGVSSQNLSAPGYQIDQADPREDLSDLRSIGPAGFWTQTWRVLRAYCGLYADQQLPGSPSTRR